MTTTKLEYPITLYVKRAKPATFSHTDDLVLFMDKNPDAQELLTDVSNKRPYFQITKTTGNEPTKDEITHHGIKPAKELVKFIEDRFPRLNIRPKSSYKITTNDNGTWTFTIRFIVYGANLQNYTKLKKYLPDGFDKDCYAPNQKLELGFKPFNGEMKFMDQFIQATENDALVWDFKTKPDKTKEEKPTDRQIYEEVMKKYPNVIKKKERKLIAYDYRIGIWVDDAESLFSVYCGQTFPESVGESTNSIHKAFYFARELPDESEFFISAERNALGKLAFKDAIWDFENATRIEFSPEYFFKYKIDRNIPTYRDDEVIAKLYKLMFEDPHPNPDVRNEVLKAYSVGITGRNPDRRFYGMIGDTGTGKSTHMSAYEHTYGEYVYNLDPKNLALTKHSNNNEHADYLVDMRYARLAFISECPKNVRWDGELLKRLSGGDKIKARRCGEGGGKGFNINCLIISFAQAIAPIEPIDDALRDRIKAIQWKVQFVKKDKGGARDTNVIEWVKTQEANDALFWITQDGVDLYNKEGYKVVDEIEDFTQETADDQDEFKIMFDKRFVISNNKEDTIGTDFIYRYFEPWSKSIQTVAGKLRNIGVEKEKLRSKTDPKEYEGQKYFYTGIKLIN